MKRFSALVILGALVVSTPGDLRADDKQEFAVPPPLISEQKFPCTKCHEHWQTKKESRQLKMNHADVVMKHSDPRSGEQRWCLDCHDSEDRNKLRLLNQELIDFDKSYNLCGQCHGKVLQDWKLGVHGKRIGSWNGEKLYRLCVHCHDPHRPAFAPVKPEPVPQKPGQAHAATGTAESLKMVFDGWRQAVLSAFAEIRQVLRILSSLHSRLSGNGPIRP